MKLGRVARRVLVGDDVTLATTARAAVDELARDANVEVALLIFPTVTMSPAAFDAWATPLRSASAEFVGAVFHPDTPYDLASAAQAVGLFRRAPDPTLQLVRVKVLDAVRGSSGKFMFDFSPAAWAELKKREHRLPTSERIARDNHALALRAGASTLQAIYDDIRADRDASYAKAGGH
jgi:hypothetical protein